MPGGSVDGAVLFGEVLPVADSPVGVGHEAVSGGVGKGQPSENVVVGGRGLLADDARGARFVIGEGHHQLPSLKVTAEDERELFHPGYQRSCLHGNLQRGTHEPAG